MKLALTVAVVALVALSYFSMTQMEPSGSFLKQPNYYLDYSDEIIDNSTNSNIQDVRTTHIHMNVTLDFDKKTLSGDVTLSMMVLNTSFSEVILDSRFLDIYSVYLNPHTPLKYYFTEPNPNIGPALHIKLDHTMVKDNFNLTIAYSTTNETLSLNFLTPLQTEGKVFPYAYTHCEAIDCRTLLPVQDTPSVKATYSALVKAPANLTVYMSGNTVNSTVVGDYKYTSIQMNTPIPSYLIALAAGNLQYARTTEVTALIEEPEVIWKAWQELKDIVATTLGYAQGFLPPYTWGDYNILILPSAFPTGGMENPLLTFVSPTILTGDKSLTYVATHELAHSWSGNLVTNRNWENFWLNEGITVYIERHITRKMYGEAFYKIQATFGNSSLYAAFEDVGINSTFASLHPNYEGHNPYDTFSEVPYEKGFQFMTYLETLIGSDNMEKFLYSYFEKFKYQSIVYQQWWGHFQDFLYSTFSAQQVKDINSKIDLDTWIYKPGPIPVKLDFYTPEIGEARQLAQDYIKLGGDKSPKGFEKYYDYIPMLKCVFLNELLDNFDKVPLKLLEKLDTDQYITQDLNPEVTTLWYQMGILRGYRKVWAYASDFMVRNGRMKFLLPLYKAFNTVDHNAAVEIYRAGSLLYHSMAKSRIRKVLGI